jgi:hypothetical protein
VKLGFENRNKMIFAGVLLAIALLLCGRFVAPLFDGSSTAAAPVAASAAAAPPDTLDLPAAKASVKVHGSGTKPGGGRSLDPTLRFDLLKISEDTKYEGTGRNIFRAFVAPPPPPVVSVATDHQSGPQLPLQPPPPPPIDLKFYGFAISKPGEAKRVFLLQGEDVFIAKEGDIVDRRYKVVHISPNAVEILDVLSNNRQSIPLTG